MKNWYEHENVTPEWIEGMKKTRRLADDWEEWEWDVMEAAMAAGDVMRPSVVTRNEPQVWRTKDPHGVPLYRHTPYRIRRDFELPSKPESKWEECKIEYSKYGEPVVMLPDWHPYCVDSEMKAILSTAMTLTGFGGVQVEGQADPDEWSMTPCCIGDNGFLYRVMDGDNKYNPRPVRYARARIMRMES